MKAIPGFVDLQVNGYVGVNFSDPKASLDDFVRASRRLLAEGTAAFLPTIVTASMETYERNLALLAALIEMPEFKNRLLGIHMEGPFISPKEGAVGAHNPAWTRKPNVADFRLMQEWARGHVRFLTIAAEEKGAEALARYCRKTGVTVSLGHELASKEDLERLAKAGATALTHLGNGIPHLINRHHNPIWSGLVNDALTAMLITDGHHLPPDLIKVMFRAKGAERIVVTSDAASLAGMPPGRYATEYREVVLEPSGFLYTPETGYLAGSSATMLRCMNHLASLGFLSEREMLKVGFENPCRLIGIDPRRIKSAYAVSFDARKTRFVVRKSA